MEIMGYCSEVKIDNISFYVTEYFDYEEKRMEVAICLNHKTIQNLKKSKKPFKILESVNYFSEFYLKLVNTINGTYTWCIQTEADLSKYKKEIENILWEAQNEFTNFDLSEHIKRLQIILSDLENFFEKRHQKEIQDNLARKKEIIEQIGYIYIIKSKHGYKIGQTTDYKKRKKSFLRLPFSFTDYRLYKIKGFKIIETQLHNLFPHKHINGEWFNLSLEDIQEIDKFMKTQNAELIIKEEE